MPVAIPVIAAVAGAAATSALAGEIGATLLGSAFLATAAASAGGFVVSTAINAVGSRALSSKKSASPSTTDLQSRAVMVTNSAQETHKIIYGEAKVSGVVEDLGTTSAGPVPFGGPRTGTNIFRHFIVILAGHEVDNIGTIFFNDAPLTLNSDGYATNIPYSYYPANPVANTQTIASAVRLDEEVTVTTTAPHGFAAGDLVTVTTTNDLSMNGNYIIDSIPTPTTFTYANGGENSSASGGTAVDETISTTQNSYIRIKKHLGSQDQLADPDMMAEIAGWDSTHRLQGLAYIYVRLEFNQDVFSSGIQNVSAIVRGKKVLDPRATNTDDGAVTDSVGSTVDYGSVTNAVGAIVDDGSAAIAPSAAAWSDNVALCIRDYLTSDYGFNCAPSEINDTYFAAAANVCDELVALTTGGLQPRYTCNGVLDTAAAPIENLNALVAAMAGTVTYVQGQFRGHAGAYEAPVGDITTDMLAGTVKIRTRIPRQQLFNAVQGTFIDPALGYASTDFPPVTNDTYVADDGGPQTFKDIQLPLTNHQEAAQRIAKIILEQGRQGITVELTLNHNGIPFSVWDNITYTDPAWGWDHKVFRIKNFSTAGIGPVVLSLQEESSASYDWNAGEATILDAAPDTNLPNPFRVTAFTGVSYTSRAISTTTGDSVYNLVLTWNLHDDAFVMSGGRAEIQFKLSSDADWRPSFFVNGDHTFADIVSGSVNTSYDIRIRAVSSLGVRSGWTTLFAALIGSSGGPSTFLDWGSVADTVGPTNDYGNAADTVGTTNDWGPVA